MRNAIKDFPKQFEFEPRIQNEENFFHAQKFIVCGMGGSQLASDLLKTLDPNLDIITHKDYGLPQISEEELKSRLIIFSSYSGNTEETVDGLKMAQEKGLHCIVISTGGRLFEQAKHYGIPCIELPNTGIQPRCAMGFGIKALLKIIGDKDALSEASELVKLLRADEFEDEGKKLATKLKGFVPVIYSSMANCALARNWKIKLNETGKVPAFYNVLPELNHNEMNSFDAGQGGTVSAKFAFIFLRDQKDHPRVLKRMDVLKKLYEDRKFPVNVVNLKDVGSLEKLFSSVLLADWTAYYTALECGMDPEQVPMVEEFKRLLTD